MNPAPATALTSVAAGLLMLCPAGLNAGEEAAAWEKPSSIPVESELFRDRLAQPRNHFLLDGQHAFVSGAEFYQSRGEIDPFLWSAHPFYRLRPDRRWTADSARWVLRAKVGNEVGDPLFQEQDESLEIDNRTPYTGGGISWAPIDALRLYASLDQNDHFSYRTYPVRLGQVGKADRDGFSWIGENLPPKSQIQVGGAVDRRGSRMELHHNRGWWWTASPVSGRVYPWEGSNTDLVYRLGEDFELSLIDQSWETPQAASVLNSSWHRSELNLAFPGSAPGGWLWRLELGYQRRVLTSDSVFAALDKASYPWSFRYRQNWSPLGMDSLKILSQGSVNVRDRQVGVQHSTELRENLGRHQPRQGLKVYYRHPFTGYQVPTEYSSTDSSWRAQSIPAKHARGYSLSADYAYKRKAFQAGWSANGGQEWETPVFHLESLDTSGLTRLRSGFYSGSEFVVINGTGQLFAAGGFWNKANWRLEGGARGFWGEQADSLEYKPSPWWIGGELGWSFPSDLRLEAWMNYLGPKEVRGWGPLFEVPAHWENNFALVQSMFANRLKLTYSALHAFGKDIREHPNGNPLRFRILVGAEGTF